MACLHTLLNVRCDQWRRFRHVHVVSAHAPKAALKRAWQDVAEVPMADIKAGKHLLQKSIAGARVATLWAIADMVARSVPAAQLYLSRCGPVADCSLAR